MLGITRGRVHVSINPLRIQGAANSIIRRWLCLFEKSSTGITT